MVRVRSYLISRRTVFPGLSCELVDVRRVERGCLSRLWHIPQSHGKSDLYFGQTGCLTAPSVAVPLQPVCDPTFVSGNRGRSFPSVMSH